MFVDSHNHTRHFSADARMTIEELISSCKELNIGKIAITEHYDYDYPHKDEPPMHFDLNAYKDTFVNWKELSNSNNGPELLMGIELGYQPHIIKDLENAVTSLPLDTVILSNHLFDGIDVYFNEECYKLTPNERNSRYVKVMAEMAEKCDNYDIIGHFDYINRYNTDKNQEMLYAYSPKEFDALFEVIIAKEKSLEINTRSIDKRIQNKSSVIMPDKEIIRRYIQMGGKMITLGSDSHDTSTLSIHFKETSEYLRSLGINELCHFENRKPVFTAIN